jgi:hypothetical protein
MIGKVEAAISIIPSLGTHAIEAAAGVVQHIHLAIIPLCK